MPLRPSDHHARLSLLLDRFGVRLRYLVEQHCGRRSGLDPDDIEQEVRIRLWRALERDRNTPLAASYIQKAVVSTVVDAVRRAQVRPTEPLPEPDSGLQLVDDATVAPEHRAMDDERVALVARAIAALPERRRAPVQLHLQGFGFVEIGGLLGVSDEAARKLVTRGLDELRSQLQAWGLESGDG